MRGVLKKATFSILGNAPQCPLTSYDLADGGINSVGHMTTLQGTRKWVGLGKQGEKFLTNLFNMLQPVLPPHHRAFLSLSWIQYEKLKVGVGSFDYIQTQSGVKLTLTLFRFLVFASGHALLARRK